MKFSFPCPQCGKSQTADWSWAGRKARCAGCNTTMVVPAPVEPAGPAEPENPPAPALTFNCPQCGRVFSSRKPELVGKKIRCGGCGDGVRVPAPGERTAAAAPSPAASAAPKAKAKVIPSAPSRAVSVPPGDDLYDLDEGHSPSSLKQTLSESSSDDPYGVDELPALGPRPRGTSTAPEQDAQTAIKKKKKKRKVGLFAGWGQKRDGERGGGRSAAATGGGFAGVISVVVWMAIWAVRHDAFGLGRAEIESAVKADYQATVDLTAAFRTIVDVPSAHAAVPRATQVIQTLISAMRSVEHKKFPQRDIDAVVESYRERRETAEAELRNELARVLGIPGVAEALMPLQGPFGELAALLNSARGGSMPFMPPAPMMPHHSPPPPLPPSMTDPNFPRQHRPPIGFPRPGGQPPNFPGQNVPPVAPF